MPPDAERTEADTELLFEKAYEDLLVRRFVGTLETAAPQVHTYSLDDGDDAEAAFAVELLPAQRTKMVLARCFRRHEALLPGETWQAAWALHLHALRERATPCLLVSAALAIPPAPPAAGSPWSGPRCK